MIRINLLPEGAAWVRAHGARAPRLSRAKWAVLLSAALFSAGGGFYVYYRFPFEDEGKARKKERRISLPPLPAKYLNVVEEIVGDKDERKLPLRTSGVLTLSYEQMNLWEKILYGASFVYRAANTVNLHAGPLVDFNTFAIADFNNFSIIGVASTRKEFAKFVKKLKNDPACSGVRVEKVGSNPAQGRRAKFKMHGSLRFALDYSQLGQGSGVLEIPGHSEYLSELRAFREMGKQQGISWKEVGPVKMSPKGPYREHEVSLSGVTTYKRWMLFLEKARESRSQISFPRWTVRAVGGSKVEIRARALFYSQND